MKPADIKRLEKVCNMYSKIIALLNKVEGNLDFEDTYSMNVLRQMDVSARETLSYFKPKLDCIKEESHDSKGAI
mgnify:CR=1 FL=1